MSDQLEVTYTLKKGQRYLTEIFNPPMLPCGIVRKGATGIGATKMELFDSPRNVIMVSPLLSILASKKNGKVLTISGEISDKLQALTEYIKFCTSTNQQYLKIHTSAESLPDLENCLYTVGLISQDSWHDWHIVLDEQDLMQLQADFRDRLLIAFDYYKEFAPANRTCVSATYFTFSDPELAHEPRSRINSEDFKPRNIRLIMTENTIEATLKVIRKTTEMVCIFVDSLSWINTIIPRLTTKDIAIYCGSNSQEKAGAYYKPYEEIPKSKICFFTSAYFVGCDLRPTDDFTLVTISDPALLTQMRGITQAQFIQIHGRFREDNEAGINSGKLLNDIVISSHLVWAKSVINPTEKDLLEKAKTELTSFSNAYAGASPALKARLIKMINEFSRDPLYVRLNNKQIPCINYPLIDSTLMKARANSELYGSQYYLKDFFEGLGYSVNYSEEYGTGKTQLIRTTTTKKEESFQKALSIVRDHQMKSMNDSLSIDLFNRKRFISEISDQTGQTRQYLELFKLIKDVDVFESTKGDLKVLNQCVDRTRLMRDEVYSGIIKKYLPSGTVLTLKHAYENANKIRSELKLPPLKTLRTIKKELTRFCKWKVANTSKSKGVLIVGH